MAWQHTILTLYCIIVLFTVIVALLYFEIYVNDTVINFINRQLETETFDNVEIDLVVPRNNDSESDASASSMNSFQSVIHIPER